MGRMPERAEHWNVAELRGECTVLEAVPVESESPSVKTLGQLEVVSRNGSCKSLAHHPPPPLLLPSPRFLVTVCLGFFEDPGFGGAASPRSFMSQSAIKKVSVVIGALDQQLLKTDAVFFAGRSITMGLKDVRSSPSLSEGRF